MSRSFKAYFNFKTFPNTFVCIKANAIAIPCSWGQNINVLTAAESTVHTRDEKAKVGKGREKDRLGLLTNQFKIKIVSK